MSLLRRSEGLFPVWLKNGSVANNVFEGNKGFYLRVPQTRIVNFTGVFSTWSNMKTSGVTHNSIICDRTRWSAYSAVWKQSGSLARGIARFRKPVRMSASIWWAITIGNVCTATTIMSHRKCKRIYGNHLSWCPKILDHYKVYLNRQKPIPLGVYLAQKLLTQLGIKNPSDIEDEGNEG